MATKKLKFERAPSTTVELRYETDEDARVREFISNINTNKDLKFTDDEIDEMLKHYHIIARVRQTLGIK